MRNSSVARSILHHHVLSIFAVVAMLHMTAGCGSGTSADGEGGGGAAKTSEAGRDNARLPEDGLSEALAPSGAAIACTNDGQCSTGICTDGFCCDSRCDNKCMACSVAKKGGGVDGICGSIAYDTDPDGECPVGRCDGKNSCKNYNGVECTSAAQCLSNYCVDGFCCGNLCMGACQACSAAKKGGGSNGVCGNIAANTDPDNECNPGECTGTGACNAGPQPTSANGAACTSGAQCASGYCADGVCCDSWCLGTCQACTAAKKEQGVDGVCGPIANDKDPDDECWGGACNGAAVCKQYNGVPCSDKAQCLSGYCADGFCCGNICNQMCYACSESKKGQGFDGVCGPIVSGRDVENECNPGECNGSGACNQAQTPQTNGTTCVSGGQCASGNCVDGVCCDTACASSCMACTATKKGGGADGTCGNIGSELDPDNDCNGGRCDGNGVCRYYNGVPCTSTGQCFSNYCVDGFCCGNVCTGACQACSNAKKGSGYDGVCGNVANGTDPESECNPGECNGGGACNQPQSQQPNGAACTLATQCSSGFCTDGVCCDLACPELCQACTAAKKGQGADGTCDVIITGTDPENECTNSDCNGAGACTTPTNLSNGTTCTASAECASMNCVDGICCDTACNGVCVACTAAKKGQGVDGTCGAIAYDTDPDDECYGGGCNGSSACAYYNSVPCANDAQCLSTYCADGFCCNNHCGDSCYACSAAKKGGGSDGVCSFIAVNTDPDNECTGGNCNGAGSCVSLAANGGACAVDAQCASGRCTDGVCCDDVCTGPCVACSAAKKGQGADGTCGAIVAGFDPEQECPNAECNGAGACQLPPNGSSCALGVQCESGYCVDGVCCDTACTSSCMACNVPGFVGTCSESSPGACGAWCPSGILGFPSLPSPVVQSARSVSIADLNEDGHLDLVVPFDLSTTSEVQVFLGYGNGLFGPGVRYSNAPNGYPSRYVSMADMNGDGKPDMVSLRSFLDKVAIRFNNGNGTFAATETFYPAGTKPSEITTADLDGNGYPDVVVTSESANTVGVLLNLGNGTLGSFATYAAGIQRLTSVVTADFSGDGKPDIAVNYFDANAVRIFTNHGNGTFNAGVNYPAGTQPKLLATGDFNGDGKPDIAAVNNLFQIQDTMTVVLNDGNGGLSAGTTYSAGADPNGIVTGDFDGDNLTDIATVNAKTTSVFRNLSGGAFAAATEYESAVFGGRAIVADFNEDNRSDIAIATGNTVGLLMNAGGSFVEGGRRYPTAVRPSAIATADFNGDGQKDLVTGGSNIDNRVGVLFGNGSAGFTPSADYLAGTGTRAPATADLNGDGKTDFVVANSGSNNVSVFMNNGNGTFAAKVDYAAGTKPMTVSAADLNGDGKPDLAVANESSATVSIFYNTGSGAFGAKVDYAAGGSTSRAITTADLNGDGWRDLVVVTSGSLKIRFNQGNGTFGAISSYAVATGSESVIAADFDNDGKVDVAIGTFGFVGVLRNNGNGTLAPVVYYANNESTTVVAAADVNGDGFLDLAGSGGGVLLLLNRGDGTFVSSGRYNAGSSAGIVATDLNGDGHPDFVVSNYNDNELTVLLNTCIP